MGPSVTILELSQVFTPYILVHNLAQDIWSRNLSPKAAKQVSCLPTTGCVPGESGLLVLQGPSSPKAHYKTNKPGSHESYPCLKSGLHSNLPFQISLPPRLQNDIYAYKQSFWWKERIWAFTFERIISEPKSLKMATAVLSLLLLVPLVISEPTCETVVTKVTRWNFEGLVNWELFKVLIAKSFCSPSLSPSCDAVDSLDKSGTRAGLHNQCEETSTCPSWSKW